MEFIVWGAGVRGKQALEIFGKNKIHCFVDNNKELVGQSIENIPIKDIEYVKKIHETKKYIVLVTPIEYEDQIIDELKSNGIGEYLAFSDHPRGVDMTVETNFFFGKMDKPKRYDGIVFQGINWFNIYMYDYFAELGLNVALYKETNDNEKVYEVLRKDYRFYDEKFINYEGWCFVRKDGSRELPGVRSVDVEEYIESMYPIYNSEISAFNDIHRDEACCIVATGPSLTLADVNYLHDNNIICISMNRIYNLFEKTSWRPDYYVVEDQKMIEDLSEDISNLDLRYKFINGSVIDYWKLEKSQSSIPYKMIMQDCRPGRVGFSLHPDRFIYNGYTVTYVCLQLAVYMGFKEIYLLGVDFNYSDDIYAESNHFEGYQKHYKDIRLNAIHPEKMLNAYRAARIISEKRGVNIYNATRGGKLEVFERKPLESIIRE
jgi:hypothetical protein